MSKIIKASESIVLNNRGIIIISVENKRIPHSKKYLLTQSA